MELMTNQEIFNEVAEALMAQGKPSTNPDGDCSYYSPNGARCAIGWLVSKDEAKKFEKYYSGEGVQDLMKAGYFEGYDQEFLVALQSSHDGPSYCVDGWIKMWMSNMVGIAKDYNLNTDVLDN